MKYVASKNQKEFMIDLKKVYKAPTKNAAEIALNELEEKWGEKYPVLTKYSSTYHWANSQKNCTS
jgi:putative transposase